MELQGLWQVSIWLVVQEGKAARVQTSPQVVWGGIVGLLIFRNATLTRWTGQLYHLQIQQAEKQH